MAFEDYARYYDLLYGDKDYRRECDYLEKIFTRFARRPVRDILDLGCGTGGHSLLLAGRGYGVTGVDISAEMLKEARAKARRSRLDLSLRRGDIRKVRLGRSFDAVVSLFAVMGYQTEDRDVRRALETAARHLRPGGLVVFDVWFGPAVLHDPPGNRRKEVSSPRGQIVRDTRCRMDLERQVVEVRFTTSLYRGHLRLEHVREVHPMRFFFPREVSLLLEAAGLSLLRLFPFGKLRGKPDRETWNVTVVAGKKTSSRP
jgi:SAM-dependent methyltransferase